MGAAHTERTAYVYGMRSDDGDDGKNVGIVPQKCDECIGLFPRIIRKFGENNFYLTQQPAIHECSRSCWKRLCVYLVREVEDAYYINLDCGPFRVSR